MSILRLKAVLSAVGYSSHSSIYKSIDRGVFTKPVQIGQRGVGWPNDEVQTILAARIAGRTDEQLRELVEKLHAKRVERFAEISGAL
jgi:prophage regulatory protein